MLLHTHRTTHTRAENLRADSLPLHETSQVSCVSVDWTQIGGENFDNGDKTCTSPWWKYFTPEGVKNIDTKQTTLNGYVLLR